MSSRFAEQRQRYFIALQQRHLTTSWTCPSSICSFPSPYSDTGSALHTDFMRLPSALQRKSTCQCAGFYYQALRGRGSGFGREQRRLVAAALAAGVSAKQKASANLTCKIALHTGTRQAWPRSSHCHVARSSHSAAPRELPHHSCRMTMDGSEFVNNLRPLNKTFEIMRQLIVKLL